MGLIRHGQTSWNALGKIQGQTDIPLNEEGIRQAQTLANRIASEDRRWDAVVSSDLRRAEETARIIAETVGISQLASDPRLRERYFGEIEGTTAADRLLRWGDEWPIEAAGVENEESVIARASSFIEQWKSEHQDISLLVVSHGNFMASMLPLMCSSAPDEHIGNLSYSILQLNDEGWTPLLYNCTAHIQKD
ncbi:histidine phosphatase family protein [Paenibacillus xylaniclasticus]|uniref:histidine phosphatase family protein n=1 Tax=Paenibacillus xylaniclasticus TaxID=588083 RepID=UPI001FE6BF88|nr:MULTISPECIES: histidine phosphatase family protein [Paenibacillus]